MFRTLYVALMIALASAIAHTAGASAPTSPVPCRTAVEEALEVASLDPSWSVLRCDGVSMTPYFGNASLMLIKTASLSDLRPGMIAVYRDHEGDLVAHTVVKVDDQGATMKGFNNPHEDPDSVTDKNLVGIVFGFIHSAGPVASAAKDLPVAYGKTM